MEIVVEKVAHFDAEIPSELLAIADTAGQGAAAAFTLRNQRTYLIRPDDRYLRFYSDILRSCVASGYPLYVEAEPEDRFVDRILIPKVRKVAELFETQGGFGIRAVASPTPLFLARDQPAEYRQRLEQAAGTDRELLITDDPVTHEILDVRPPFDGELAAVALPASHQLPVPQDLVDLGITVTPITTLTAIQVQAVFRYLAQLPHIPFDYPDDCCHARAHEMFRVLRLVLDIQCRKVWNFGGDGNAKHSGIRFFTLTHPDGLVPWLGHVAPLVEVELPNGKEVDMVLDPSMFHRPARIPEWVSLQHDSTAVQEITDDPALLYQWVGGTDISLDPSFQSAADILGFHRGYRNQRMALLRS